jgi:type I restriction enzyme S subunit
MSLLKDQTQFKSDSSMKNSQSDETVNMLLNNLKIKKETYIKQKIIQKQKSDDITDNEIPFIIPNNWMWVRLSDISIIQEGPGIRKFQYTKEGIRFLTVTNITENGVDLEKSKKYIAKNEFEKKYKHFKLHKGDIVNACSGASWGKSAIFDENIDMILNTSTLRLRFFGDIGENLFLYYLTKTNFFKTQLEKQLSGMQPNFGISHYSKILVPLPPLPEQKRIVAILDEAFESIGKAKENAERNLNNAKEIFDSYLNSITADKNSLGELVDIRTGKLDSNAAIKDGIYPFFTCSREIFAIDNFAFDCEAILLAGNNAVGDFNVKHYKGKFNAYQRTYIITVNQKNLLLYRYLYFQLLKSLKEFKQMSVGAGTKFLKLGMIKDLQISLPSITEQQSIVSKLDSLSQETKKLEAIYTQKLADLEELKKSILAKAFEGKLTEASA